MSDRDRVPKTTEEQTGAYIAYQNAAQWQEFFNCLTEYSNEKELARKVENELNAQFPYKGRTVYMSGYGFHPVLTECGDESGVGVWCYEEGREGRHEGFTVINTPDQDGAKAYQIMQRIIVGGRKQMVSPNKYREEIYFDLFNLRSSLLLVDDFNSIYANQGYEHLDMDNQRREILESSVMLSALLRSTAFRRMPLSKQQHQVSSMYCKLFRLLHSHNRILREFVSRVSVFFAPAD